MSLDLCYLSATEAIARFKAGTLSPVAFMQAIVERAEQVEAKINAFSYTYMDDALATFRNLGAIVEPVDLDWTFEALQATTSRLTYTILVKGAFPRWEKVARRVGRGAVLRQHRRDGSK